MPMVISLKAHQSAVLFVRLCTVNCSCFFVCISRLIAGSMLKTNPLLPKTLHQNIMFHLDCYSQMASELGHSHCVGKKVVSAVGNLPWIKKDLFLKMTRPHATVLGRHLVALMVKQCWWGKHATHCGPLHVSLLKGFIIFISYFIFVQNWGQLVIHTCIFRLNLEGFS